MKSAFRSLLLMAAVAVTGLMPQTSLAQDRRWIQVEARPTSELALERARDFAGSFSDTWGYGLPSGWFAIVLGPYEALEAQDRMGALKAQGSIPQDSYVTDGREFRDQFWPQDGLSGLSGIETPAIESMALDSPEAVASELEAGMIAETPVEPRAEPDVLTEPAAPLLAQESLAEARALEAALSPEDKKALQTALQWFGFYEGGIDGAFGAGTRNSMAAWQQAFALEATGVLTSAQRATLVASHQAELADYGFALVEEQESGIDVTLPLALVEFDRYEPPFVHFREKNGSGLSLVLISQPGDAGSFAGLYDIIATLDAMPPGGERRNTGSEFFILGADARHDSRAWAQLDKGLIKGWMVFTDPANAARDSRAIEVMAYSFRAVGDTALDPGLVPLDEAARRGLVAGLDVQKPKQSRSGFYISPEGAVLTALPAVQGCDHITLDHATLADVVLADEASGIAVLKAKTALAPPAYARLPAALARPGAPVVVAGYPWEGKLPAPVLSHGTFEDVGGLDGEAGLIRLSAKLRAGDVGAPVIDASGTVLGLVLPSSAAAGQELPQEVVFAADPARIAQVAASAGVTMETAAQQGPALPPETLNRQAVAMTVLVSCWP